jgi:hypothetical protein
MPTGSLGFKVYLGIVAVTGCLLAASHTPAGTLNGMDDPDRVPGEYIVVLKRDHIVSLKNRALTDVHEIAAKSEKWKDARAAADAEVAQIVNRLETAYPHIRISAVMSHGQAPGFVLRASDENARAIANDDDVEEVDAGVALKNLTLSIGPDRPTSAR